jgi:hypothetical protein
MLNLSLDSLEKQLDFFRFVFSFGLLAFFLEILRRDHSISHGEFSSNKEALVYPMDRILPIPVPPE